MRKLICIFMCMFVLIGCSPKKEDNSILNESNQSETVEGIQTENTNRPDYETYSAYIGIRNKEGAWYYDVPYLNEVSEGYGKMYLHSDDWWLTKVAESWRSDTNVNNLEEAKEKAFDMFFTTIDWIFEVDENGFVETSSNYETHSGIEMLKVEGTATDAEFEIIGECWVYGYIFILEGKPAAFLGMNQKDKTEETKEMIKMYIDDMANSLVYKSY